MRILYATDGSPHAWRAAELLVEIADRGGNEVTALSVVSTGGVMPMRPQDDDASRIAAEDTIKDAVGFLRRSGFRAGGRVVKGLPAQAIAGLGRSGAYDLTVVGAGSRSRLLNAFIGSVSRHVLHRSPTSVLVVHDLFAKTSGPKALIGVDGSAESEAAVSLAADLLDQDRCEVRVIAVAEVPALIAPPPFADLSYEALAQTIPDIEREALRGVEKAAVRAAKHLRARGFRTEDVALLGNARATLLEEAVDGEFDVIVVGSRGLGPFKSALLGSVSDWIAHRSPAALVARGRATFRQSGNGGRL